MITTGIFVWRTQISLPYILIMRVLIGFLEVHVCMKKDFRESSGVEWLDGKERSNHYTERCMLIFKVTKRPVEV